MQGCSVEYLLAAKLEDGAITAYSRRGAEIKRHRDTTEAPFEILHIGVGKPKRVVLYGRGQTQGVLKSLHRSAQQNRVGKIANSMHRGSTPQFHR